MSEALHRVRVLVTGSRTWTDGDAVFDALDQIAGWAAARRALDAALRHDDAQLWVEADEMEQVDLELAFLAADRMTRVLEQVLSARHQRWMATRDEFPRSASP